jgi:hypothetical protein
MEGNRCLMRAPSSSGIAPASDAMPRSAPRPSGGRGAPRARAAVRSIRGSSRLRRRPEPSAFLGVRQERPGVESQVVEERWREIEARLEPPLLIFALLTIPAIALEYVAQEQPWHAIGIVLNWMIWLAFVAEVVIMLRVVPDRGAG